MGTVYAFFADGFEEIEALTTIDTLRRAGLDVEIVSVTPDEIVVGMQVSGSHMSSAHEGDTVRAVGTIIHKGRSSHVWNVDVFTSTDKLVSSIRGVNSILKKK